MDFSKENKVVYGLFETRAALETAVGRLKAEGFLSSDISVLLPTIEGSKEFTIEREVGPLGSALGWLAGIGTLSIPGLGPFVAAGPILATLECGGIGTLGGITEALVAMGIPEYEAKRFEFSVKDGGMLLSVHAGLGEWVEEVILIFQECGAHDISTTTDTLYNSKSQNTSPHKRF